jgi:hypothetical protein
MSNTSRSTAALVAVLVGLLAAGLSWWLTTGYQGESPAVARGWLAATTGVMGALTAGLTAWAFPRLNDVAPADLATGQAAKRGGIAGGAAGGLVVLACTPIVFFSGLAFDVRMALALETFLVAMAGFSGATTLVVVRLSTLEEDAGAVATAGD